MTDDTIAVIPARMGSSRYPGKPLCDILGKTMIEHVYRRTAMSGLLDRVIVATCDEEIRETVEEFGGEAVMTSDSHERASERVVEAARQLDGQLIVMVQGDEPMVHPEMIDEAVEPMLDDQSIGCLNLVHRIDSEEEYRDPDTIKVVQDGQGRALYFSREPIPTSEKQAWGEIPTYKQVCIIPFRRERLERYAKLAPTPLEKAESIDMLRFLEHGYDVHLAETRHSTQAVDRPGDRERVENLLQDDALVTEYIQ